MKPTLGRVVWFHMQDVEGYLAAIVANVNPDGTVNLSALDRTGWSIPVQNVQFIEGRGADTPSMEEASFATWMPYQEQKAKEEAKAEAGGIPIKATDMEFALGSSMTFGTALYAMKRGMKVARKEWRDSGVVIYLPHNKGNSFITTLYLNNLEAPWPISQTDVLAEDWYVAT